MDAETKRAKTEMRRTIASLCLLSFALYGCARQPMNEAAPRTGDDFLGHWDMTVQGTDATYPSWFEVTRQDGDLVGRFVGRVGSARPIETLRVDGDQLTFSLPIQYEANSEDLRFEGRLTDGRIQGTTNGEDGSTLTWTAVPAPALERTGPPEWGEPIELTAGNIGDHWHARYPNEADHWSLSGGVLASSETGTDLVTNATFEDFKLHLEFQYPKDSNSGVYLRGRYEIQIQDDYGKQPTNVLLGGVYGFLTPSVAAGKPAGEWQTYDVTLIGRRITVALNDQIIIDDEEIPGITGGALDSDEGAPGPLMLQGDHGPISFRNIVVTPAR